MLFTMALMVSFGVAATWKVRALNAVHEGVWRDRSLCLGGADPQIESLPTSASMGSSLSANDLTRTPPYWWDQPGINQTFVRGPAVQGEGHQQTSGIIHLNNRRHFEMEEGVRDGTANLQRRYAMLPRTGSFEYNLTLSLLDSRWQFQSQGYPRNNFRRAKNWYRVEDPPGLDQELLRRYRDAKDLVESQELAPPLRPLDRDDELYQFYGGYSDFYPRINVSSCGSSLGCIPTCTTNQQTVESLVQDVVRGVQGQGGGRGGVPGTMARTWIRMYEIQLQQEQARMPPDPARIAQLEEWLEQLRSFEGGMSP